MPSMHVSRHAIVISCRDSASTRISSNDCTRTRSTLMGRVFAFLVSRHPCQKQLLDVGGGGPDHSFKFRRAKFGLPTGTVACECEQAPVAFVAPSGG